MLFLISGGCSRCDFEDARKGLEHLGHSRMLRDLGQFTGIKR